MKTYTCKVRVNGSLLNVVRKNGVTAAEIAVLRHIHGTSPNGAAPVVDVKPEGNVQRSETAERKRLAENYSMGEMRGPALVKDVLGVEGVPLPQYVPGVDDPEIEKEPVAPATDAKPVRTRVAPAKEAAPAA